jgi:hypothetical protein
VYLTSVHDRIKVYMRKEEAVKALGKIEKPINPSSKVRKEKESSSRKRKKDANTEGRDQRPSQRWTPLNASLSVVFMEARKDPSFKPLPKMRTLPTKHNSKKYCEYHHDHGHWIEECVVLKKEVEMFIQCGKLEKFIAKGEGVRNYLWDDLSKGEEPRCKLITLEILKGLCLDE